MHKENKPETQRAYQLLESMNALSQDPGDLFLVSMGTDSQYAAYFGKRRAGENCHTQLSNLNDHYQMGVDVLFLSSMVAEALVR